jgi:hypothetical protein
MGRHQLTEMVAAGPRTVIRDGLLSFGQGDNQIARFDTDSRSIEGNETESQHIR